MTWWRVRSSPATAARTATVLPEPTSPTMTPSRSSAMQKPMRATASAWAARGNRFWAGLDLLKGMWVRPKWVTEGARLIARPPG